MKTEEKNAFTLSEIRAMKQQLEDKITALLTDFEDTVGTEITAAGIETIHSSGGRLSMDFKIEIAL